MWPTTACPARRILALALLVSFLALTALPARAQQQQQPQPQQPQQPPAQGGAASPGNQTESKTISQIVAENKELSSLAELVSAAGLQEEIGQLLNASSAHTLFAPSNNAINAAQVNASDIAWLKNVLLYHVLDASFASTDLNGTQFPRTMLKNDTLVRLNGQGQVVVVSKNNGTTVSYGLGTANVTTADVKATNGIVHIIDNVLLPPKKPSETLAQANCTKVVELLQKANYTDTIDQRDGITIFAPTDSALENYGNRTANMSSEEVASLLKRHVIPTVIYSDDIIDGKTVTASDSNELKCHVNGTNVTVNGATVSKKDLLTWNGVIHVIDSVLLHDQKSTPNNSMPPNNGNPASDGTRLSTVFTAFGLTAFVAVLFV